MTRKKRKKDSQERLEPAVDKIDELSVKSTETESNKTEVSEDTVGNTKQPEPKSQAVQSEEVRLGLCKSIRVISLLILFINKLRKRIQLNEIAVEKANPMTLITNIDPHYM